MEQLAITAFGTPLAMARSVVGVFAVLLLAAAWRDGRSYRIPNGVVFGGALFALLAHAALPGGDGFITYPFGGLGWGGALRGLAFGVAVLLPLYLLHALGAGDVKLMGMAGAFLGPVDVWGALLGTVLAGGVLAVAVAAWRGVMLRMLANVRDLVVGGVMCLPLGMAAMAAPPETAARLPYGVAIAAGTLGYVAVKGHYTGLI